MGSTAGRSTDQTGVYCISSKSIPVLPPVLPSLVLRVKGWTYVLITWCCNRKRDASKQRRIDRPLGTVSPSPESPRIQEHFKTPAKKDSFRLPQMFSWVSTSFMVACWEKNCLNTNFIETAAQVESTRWGAVTVGAKNTA